MAEVNLELWSAQYPELLPKNILGIARIYDKNHPPVTQTVLPAKNSPFHFQWNVNIDPGQMAPYVTEGGNTPLINQNVDYETFVCRETRVGCQITNREVDFGLKATVTTRTQSLVDACNLAQEFESVQALTGTNLYQNTGRMTSTAVANPWSDFTNGTPVRDIIDMKTNVEKKSGQIGKHLFLGWDEARYFMEHPQVLDEVKYTTPALLESGLFPYVKGLQLHTIGGFYKSAIAASTTARTYLLSTKGIVTTDNVGFTAIAEPKAGTAPQMYRWEDVDRQSIVLAAKKSFVPVVEDYSRIGVMTSVTT